MENNRFDLIDIIKLLRSKSKTILIFTVLGLVASIIFVLIRKNVYTSETKLMVKSFMYFDRNQMYGEEAYYVRDVFAKEDEIDKAMTILESDDVIGDINEKTKYAEQKNLSQAKAFKQIKKCLKVKRTDNSNIEVKFTDEDPKLAFAAENAALVKAESIYLQYFEDYNKDVTSQLDFKRRLLLDSIAVINTHIADIRKEYNIYNALAPVRGTVLSANTSMNAANAEGIEKLETQISIKDRMDQEIAKLTGLKSQYNSFLNDNKMHVFYKVGGPYEPTIPSNIPALFVVLASALTAFIFACLWILIGRAYSRRA